MKLFYKALNSQDGPSFSWKSIWRVKAPSRVAFFVWTAALGKISMLDHLRKMNVAVVEWCCMCKMNGKSIDHLLLHYEVMRKLWCYILNLFGVEWIMPRQVNDLLNSWGGQVGCSPVKEVWRLAPMCLMWCLWRKRNTRYF